MRTLLELYQPSEVKGVRFCSDIFRVILRMISHSMDSISEYLKSRGKDPATTPSLLSPQNITDLQEIELKSKIDHLGLNVQILLRFFSEMYCSADDMKAAICTTEAIDEII
ncbi:hypothetical protein HK096_011048, partial [Nowakowskiella sp. JEL0078]